MKRPELLRHLAIIFALLPALAGARPAFAGDAPACIRDDQCPRGAYCDHAGVCRTGTPALPESPPPPRQPVISAPPPALPESPPTPRRTLKALWIPSLVVFSTMYALTIAGTTAVNLSYGGPPNYRSVGLSFVPALGPWLILGTQNVGGTQAQTAGQIAALVASGVLQDLGLAGLIAGLSIKTGVGVDKGRAAARWIVLPQFRPGYAGATATVLAF